MEGYSNYYPIMFVLEISAGGHPFLYIVPLERIEHNLLIAELVGLS